MGIKKFLPTVQENISLAEHTTFKIGGPARYFLVSKSEEDLIKAIKTAKKLKLPFFNSRLNIQTLTNQGSTERSDSGAKQVLILGGGSNVLFSDKGYDGLVIKCQMSNVKCQKGKIYVEAGTKLGDVLKLTVKNSLTGLEWAIGIPGTIGGAVYGNSGAFGQSIGKMTYSVRALNRKNLKVENILKKDCKFSNKNSIFKQKNNLIILSVVLKLRKGNKIKIQKKIKEFSDYRKKSQPSDFFSAGCAFQNYEGKISNKKLLEYFPQLEKFNRQKLIPASYLIDKCGLKGRKSGKAEISEKNANFILNLGGAKAVDVIRLIRTAKQKVKNKFGITLKEEVKIINT